MRLMADKLDHLEPRCRLDEGIRLSYDGAFDHTVLDRDIPHAGQFSEQISWDLRREVQLYLVEGPLLQRVDVFDRN